jgi:hypothetical protein
VPSRLADSISFTLALAAAKVSTLRYYAINVSSKVDADTLCLSAIQRVVEELTEKLALKSDQKSNISSIIISKAKHMSALGGFGALNELDRNSRMQEVISSALNQIKAILLKDQLVIFEQINSSY